LRRVLLLSIHPRYTDSILSGTKTVELRRTRPRVQPGDSVLIYASSPVKAIVGGFVVDGLIQAQPAGLWDRVKHLAGVSQAEYDGYFSGVAVGYGIRIAHPWRLPDPVGLEALRARRPSFRPPQSYSYLLADDDLLPSAPDSHAPAIDRSTECGGCPPELRRESTGKGLAGLE